MTRLVALRLSGLFVLTLLAGGCSWDSPPDPANAQATHGATVDATEAVPAPAVAAEERLYVGRSLAVDGRITSVGADGCAMQLDAETKPLVVTAARASDGSCAWEVPADTDGFAVAVGTLRAANDTLRLTANGVRVTPVRLSDSDS